MGRAPCTKETLPDFLRWRRVTRPPLVFHGLTGSQRTTGFWGVTVSLLEKLNPMIKDKMEKNQKGPYHGLKRFAVGFSPEIWTTVASTAHTQYGQVVEAAVRDERSMSLKSQATHSQGQKQSGSTWVQGGSSKQLGFYGLFI